MLTYPMFNLHNAFFLLLTFYYSFSTLKKQTSSASINKAVNADHRHSQNDTFERRSM